jgi:hypothetical protein
LKSSSNLLALDDLEIKEFQQYHEAISQVDHLGTQVQFLMDQVHSLVDPLKRSSIHLFVQMQEMGDIVRTIVMKQQDVYLPYIIQIQAFIRGVQVRFILAIGESSI